MRPAGYHQDGSKRPESPRRLRNRYELILTWRCVPGSQVCSGRAGGAGCQSKARSTSWCICRNHQREVKGGGRGLVRDRWVKRGLPSLSSSCVSVILCLSVFAPSVGIWVGQIRSNPYKYGNNDLVGCGGGTSGSWGKAPGRRRRRDFRIIPNIDNGSTRASLSLPCAERWRATSTVG